ncbi:TPA: hypothetical protein DEO28_03590 [Candidatus Dependentiae bacterium]|nr:MAG: hypothetical protein UR14_C0007G0019 [candidate division TM6 bacterium GW2011_GWE2_31_21]KKP53620.1 MAG: hypothetical protein UR43_C0004G0161 [candidate division TM6 bacterium GW2011_GWF2_33_332]HBS48140.1 hypothetical protein [Candidatus Dependentiae bacterium]HBZ73564.1 hypothetical protein [Candidatus Dependentiae bacterium]
MKKLFLFVLLISGLNFQSLFPGFQLFNEQTIANFILSTRENPQQISQAISLFKDCIKDGFTHADCMLSRSDLLRMIDLGKSSFPGNYLEHTHCDQYFFLFLNSFNKILRDFNFINEDFVEAFVYGLGNECNLSARIHLKDLIEKFQQNIITDKRREVRRVISQSVESIILFMPSEAGLNISDDEKANAFRLFRDCIQGNFLSINFKLSKLDIERMLSLIEKKFPNSYFRRSHTWDYFFNLLSSFNFILRIYNFDQTDLEEVLSPYFEDTGYMTFLINEFKRRIINEKRIIFEEIISRCIPVILSTDPNDLDVLPEAQVSRPLRSEQIGFMLNEIIMKLSIASFSRIDLIEGAVITELRLLNKKLRTYGFDSNDLHAVLSRYCKGNSYMLPGLVYNLSLCVGRNVESAEPLSQPRSIPGQDPFVLESREKHAFLQRKLALDALAEENTLVRNAKIFNQLAQEKLALRASDGRASGVFANLPQYGRSSEAFDS